MSAAFQVRPLPRPAGVLVAALSLPGFATDSLPGEAGGFPLSRPTALGPILASREDAPLPDAVSLHAARRAGALESPDSARPGGTATK